MSDPIALRFENVRKDYLLHTRPAGRILHALGLDRRLSWLAGPCQKFSALENIDLEVNRGERIGVVGSNGAGKSTMLKLLVGNLQPSSGQVLVNGDVQALMSTGAGFHPEYSGRENVLASLSANGLGPGRASTALDEIVSFTELEKFIDQPFRTYSAGMQARLTFATATAIEPEILIIDEVLGAGDAYFIAKSVERIEELVTESGATVILVSHDMTAIQKFSHRVLWLDEGRIRDQGPTFDVVRRYQKWMRDRNEARLIEAGRRTDAQELSQEEHIWSGATGLKIERVEFTDRSGRPQHIFETKEAIDVHVTVRSTGSGDMPLTVAVVFYRPDGTCQSQFLSDAIQGHWEPDSSRRFSLRIPEPRYGNGRYLVSIGLYKAFEEGREPEFYEAHDREYEIEVDGNPWYHVAATTPDSEWRMNVDTRFGAWTAHDDAETRDQEA